MASPGALEALPDEHGLDLAGDLRRGVDERDVAPQEALQHGRDQRVVRAAHDHHVRALGLERLGEAAHRVGERLAGDVPGLDEVDQAGAGLLDDLGAGVEAADGSRVGPAGHGGLGGQHADLAVARGLHGRSRPRHHHADDRRLELLLERRQRRRGRRVAGDDDELDRHGLEKRRDLAREQLQLRRALLAVREPGRVADVGEVLARQLHEALVQHGEPAHARVEHPDGQGGEVVQAVGGGDGHVGAR